MKDSIIHGIIVSTVLFIAYIIIIYLGEYHDIGFIVDSIFLYQLLFIIPQLLYLFPLMILLRRKQLKRTLLGVKIALVTEFMMNLSLWIYLIVTGST